MTPSSALPQGCRCKAPALLGSQAIFIDHVVQQSNGSITLWLGLLCYIPFTFAYAHLMLTHQGVDGSASVQSVRDMCCCAAWRRKPATTNEASLLLEGKAP